SGSIQSAVSAVS
ncbi:transcriptional regulator, MerR family, partial [Vibrio parahaemolyticus V-223/04]